MDGSGFPKENNNNISDPAVTASGLTGSFTDTADPTNLVTVKEGTVNFEDGKRPSQAGDDFKAELDLTFSNGKKYKATVSGPANPLPTNPAPPSCPDDEYAKPIYE